VEARGEVRESSSQKGWMEERRWCGRPRPVAAADGGRAAGGRGPAQGCPRLQPFSQKPRSPVRPTVTYQSYMNHISEGIREIFWSGIDRPSPGSWQSPILTVVERSRDEHGSERLSFKSITSRTRARFVLRRHFVQKPADVAGHRGHIAHNAASVHKSAKDCRAQWQYPSGG